MSSNMLGNAKTASLSSPYSDSAVQLDAKAVRVFRRLLNERAWPLAPATGAIDTSAGRGLSQSRHKSTDSLELAVDHLLAQSSLYMEQKRAKNEGSLGLVAYIRGLARHHSWGLLRHISELESTEPAYEILSVYQPKIYTCPACRHQWKLRAPLEHCSLCEWTNTGTVLKGHKMQPKPSDRRPITKNVMWKTYLADWRRQLVIVQLETTRTVQVVTDVWESEPRKERVTRYYVVMAEDQTVPIRNDRELADVNATYFPAGVPLKFRSAKGWRVLEPVEEAHGPFASLEDAENVCAWWASEINQDLRDSGGYVGEPEDFVPAQV